MVIERPNDGTFTDTGLNGALATPVMMLPLSTAVNGDELLADVEDVIRHEPRRLYMSDWVMRGWKFLDLFSGRRKAPACHTAGCVAGWIMMLHDGAEATAYAEGRAIQILKGVGGYDLGLHGLFHGDVYEAELEPGYARPNVEREKFTAAIDDEEGQVKIHFGEKGYARAVVNRIRRFRAFYGEALKAVPVTPTDGKAKGQ